MTMHFQIHYENLNETDAPLRETYKAFWSFATNIGPGFRLRRMSFSLLSSYRRCALVMHNDWYIPIFGYIVAPIPFWLVRILRHGIMSIA